MLIMLDIRSLNGQSTTIKLPPIKQPINLSSLVSPPSLLGENQSLLDYINSGVLELIEPGDAVVELSDPKVAAAVKKALRDTYNRTSTYKKNPTVGKQTKIPKVDIDDLEPINPMEKMMKAAASDIANSTPGKIRYSEADQDLNPKIMQMCATLKSDPSTSEDHLEELDLLPDSDLSDNDLGYLIHHSGVKKIRDWAEVKLAERVEDEEDDGDEEDESDTNESLEKAAASSAFRSSKKRRKSGGRR